MVAHAEPWRSPQGAAVAALEAGQARELLQRPALPREEEDPERVAEPASAEAPERVALCRPLASPRAWHVPLVHVARLWQPVAAAVRSPARSPHVHHDL